MDETNRLRLVLPQIALEQSYRSFIKEWHDSGETLVPFPLTFPYNDFARLVERLNDARDGIGVPDGFVENTTYWLVQAGEILGVSNLRHRLTPSLLKEGGHIGYGIRPGARGKGLGTTILALTLQNAIDIGISEFLITCDKENSASVAVIRANGGVFEDEHYSEARGAVIQRYWIKE